MLAQISEKALREQVFVSKIPNLSLWKRISLRVFGEAFVGYIKPHGYSDYVEIYLAKCHTHGLFYVSPNGYCKKKYCTKCIKEQLVKLKLI